MEYWSIEKSRGIGGHRVYIKTESSSQESEARIKTFLVDRL